MPETTSLPQRQDFYRNIGYTLSMGTLVKLIVILGLVFLITSQFTRSKTQRAQRRDKWTNILLGLVVVMLGLSILTSLLTR